MTAPRPRSRVLLILAVAVVALAVAAFALYAARKTIARDALVGWLRDRGIASEATIGDIGLSGVTAQLKVGDPKAPDLTVGDAEVTYGLSGLALEVRTVTLRRTVLKARWRNGGFSVGALDPLVAEFLKRPPPVELKLPRMVFEDAVVELATDYGPVSVKVDARVDDSKLKALTAVSAPMRLKGEGFEADVGAGLLTLATTGDRTDVQFKAPVSGVKAGAARLGAGRLSLSANAPYPDIVKRRGDGALTLAARLTADTVSADGRTLRGVEVSAGFGGQVAGWIPDLAVSGKATADVRAAGGDLGGAQAGPVRIAVTTPDARWTRKGGDAVAATLRVTGTAERVTASDLTLSDLVVAGLGPLAADARGVRLALGGSVIGRGRWSGLGAPAGTDSAQVAAVRRAARGFSFAAAGLRAELGATPTFHLTQPLTLRPDRGGEARIAPTGRDSARLLVSGGGLPAIDAQLTRVRLAAAGPSANLALKAAVSVGPAEGAEVDAAGDVALANGRLSFAATRCALVLVAHLEFGERDIDTVAGRLCGVTLTAGAGGWAFSGRAEALAAEVPWMQARLRDGAVGLAFTGAAGRMAGAANVETARITDAATDARFNPLVLSGPARLAADVWTADLALKLPAGTSVATLALRHEARTGKGGVQIEAALTFAEGGLQPSDLSPLAEAVGSPTAGTASFSGFFAWSPELGINYGTVRIPGLDFKSPAGQVHGLKGEIVLTSLAPLVVKAGQSLSAERLDALVPLTDIRAGLEIGDEVVRITGGEASVEGGRVKVVSLELPLKPGETIRGLLAFEGVQLAKLVEASPFRDFMDLDAKVSGRVPFEITAGKVRIAGGDLKAIQPGRLSINKQLFTQAAVGTVTAGGAAPGPDPNETFRDLAYQAMENLLFDELTATLNSQTDGRMGVLFRVVGRHDPPQKVQLKLTVMDLIRKRFLGRQLPLPSGTKVNLTLETTMNLDQLLADYAEVNRQRGR